MCRRATGFYLSEAMTTLKAVAAGDSWLVHLPFHLGTGGGLANALFGDIMGIPYTNLAHAGDSSEESMGTAMAAKLEAALPGADILLWSSGGDDFAGDEFEIFLDENDGRDASLAVNMDRFQVALDVTMMDYARLVELRDRVAPNCLIACHGYDYPPASQMGNGFLTFGPWLQPGLIRRGWKDADDQSKAVRAALDALAKRLSDFAAVTPRVLFVNQLGACKPEHWANELHLNSGGCAIHARGLHYALLPRLDEIAFPSSPH